MYASIDAAVSTIERQNPQEQDPPGAPSCGRMPFAKNGRHAQYVAPVEPKEEEFRILRTKRFPLKPMTRDEAILQMNLLEHSFFAFRDTDADGAFAIVYSATTTATASLRTSSKFSPGAFSAVQVFVFPRRAIAGPALFYLAFFGEIE